MYAAVPIANERHASQRFLTGWRRGLRTPGWWAAAALGFALVVLDLAGQAAEDVVSWQTAYFLFAMTAGLLVGLWAWGWRSPPRMGKLMFWWPALVLAADLPSGFPDSELVSTIGLATLIFGYIIVRRATQDLAYRAQQFESAINGNIDR